MNRNLLIKRATSFFNSFNKYPTAHPFISTNKYPFSTEQSQTPIYHKFTYGQGG